MRLCALFLFINCSFIVVAQQFTNPDLEGIVVLDETSVLPACWENISADEPYSLANLLETSDTPDLTSNFGPSPIEGIWGMPYSGNSFLSGRLAQSTSSGSIWHEGIFQTVSGFKIDSFYTITFYQSVVKQNDAQDSSGSWVIYIDDQLRFSAEASQSLTPYDDPALQWDLRAFTFQAQNTVHKFSFLPLDDDQNILNFSSGSGGALRVGIDSISMRTPCNLSENFEESYVLSCDQDSIIINAFVPNGNYQWFDGQTTPTISVSTGTFRVTITGENGCIESREITVRNHPTELFDLGPDREGCKNEAILLGSAIDGATYSWQDGSTLVTYEATESGLYWVEVDLGGCIKRDSIIISHDPLDNFTLGVDRDYCPDDPFSLTPSPAIAGTIYNWFDGYNEESYFVTQPGAIWVETDHNGCIHSDTIQIGISDLMPFSLGTDTAICSGDSLLLSPVTTPSVSYLWSDQSTQASLWAKNATDYSLTISLNACEETAEINISHHEPTSLSLGTDTTVCHKDNFILTPKLTGPSPQFNWQDGSTQSTLPVLVSGIYELTLTTTCATLIEDVNITLDECPCLVYIPNAFSPNTDQINDLFHPYTNCSITNYSMQIYDRWGGLVYETKEVDKGWTGEGHIPGTYIYTIFYTDQFGARQQKAGEVKLIR